MASAMSRRAPVVAEAPASQTAKLPARPPPETPQPVSRKSPSEGRRLLGMRASDGELTTHLVVVVIGARPRRLTPGQTSPIQGLKTEQEQPQRLAQRDDDPIGQQ